MKQHNVVQPSEDSLKFSNNIQHILPYGPAINKRIQHLGPRKNISE